MGIDTHSQVFQLSPMPRRARHFQQSLCYHVMNRGLNRQDIFVDDEDRRRFTDRVVEYAELADTKVYHWVWMSNHYHALVEVAYVNLRRFAGGLQQSYAQDYHSRHGTSGVFWQGRFKSKPVEIGEYLARCGRYIERNPVRAKLVKAAEDYAWSSAGTYVTGKADGVTTPDPYMGADTREFKRQEYRDILAAGTDDAWMAERHSVRVLGSMEFAGMLKREDGRYRRKSGRRAR